MQNENADTITDEQIRGLRAEAEAAGDVDQVRLCGYALGWGPAEYQGPGMRLYARAQCARVINAARAQED